MATPELWIIGGPNGAGKTTLVQDDPIRSLIPQATALNPDDLTREQIQQAGFATFAAAPLDLLEREFVRSADLVLEQVQARLLRGESVVVESVLSTDKYQPVVETVLATGGFFGLVYVALASPQLAQQRVQARVALGGHSVPPDKIAARWHRSLARLTWFAARAHRLFVLDNSDTPPRNPPRLLAEKAAGVITIHEPAAIPELTSALKSAATT
jgi:predicted ABC-type ATPase